MSLLSQSFPLTRTPPRQFRFDRHNPGANVGIGLNWMVQRAGSDTIIWHHGGTGGYRTFAGFVPSAGMGVVLLTNSGNAGADDIAMHLLVPRLPLAPKPAPPKQRTAIELPESILDRYVGLYQLAPEFSIEVTRKGAALFAQATGQDALQLWPESETDFFLSGRSGHVRSRRAGPRKGLVLHQGGGNAPGKKVR